MKNRGRRLKILPLADVFFFFFFNHLLFLGNVFILHNLSVTPISLAVQGYTICLLMFIV